MGARKKAESAAAPQKRQISAWLPQDLVRHFRAQCALADITQSDAMAEALLDWLRKHGAQVPKGS